MFSPFLTQVYNVILTLQLDQFWEGGGQVIILTNQTNLDIMICNFDCDITKDDD